MRLYRAQFGFVNLDSANPCQIEAPRSERRCPAQSGQGEEERFGEGAASPNSQKQIARDRNPEEIASIKLAALCPCPLDLAWHDNRTSFFSCRKSRLKIHLRLHRLFAKAPSPVLEAVVGYAVKGDKRSGTVVRQMAHLYFSKEKAKPDPLEEKGEVYDLGEIRDRIKERYFPTVDVSIGWSARSRAKAFRCITFGSYDRHRNQVRINPLLDNADVPLFFLEFIVYHEMLHAVCPASIDARGAVRCHTPEFRRMEKQFAEYGQAKEWEKKSLQFFRRAHGRS